MHFDFYPLPTKMIRFDLRICSSKLGVEQKTSPVPANFGREKNTRNFEMGPKVFSKGKVYGSQISLGISRDSNGTPWNHYLMIHDGTSFDELFV